MQGPRACAALSPPPIGVASKLQGLRERPRGASATRRAAPPPALQRLGVVCWERLPGRRANCYDSGRRACRRSAGASLLQSRSILGYVGPGLTLFW